MRLFRALTSGACEQPRSLCHNCSEITLWPQLPKLKPLWGFRRVRAEGEEPVLWGGNVLVQQRLLERDYTSQPHCKGSLGPSLAPGRGTTRYKVSGLHPWGQWVKHLPLIPHPHSCRYYRPVPSATPARAGATNARHPCHRHRPPCLPPHRAPTLQQPPQQLPAVPRCAWQVGGRFRASLPIPCR